MNTEELLSKIRETGRTPTSYSGRGMYGKYCVAVHLDQFDYGADLPQEGIAKDAMGRGIVVYWPKHKPTKEMLDE